MIPFIKYIFASIIISTALIGSAHATWYLSDLGKIADFGDVTNFVGISNTGVVAGNIQNRNNSDGYPYNNPFRWDPVNGFVNLNNDGSYDSGASALNSIGQVVGRTSAGITLWNIDGSSKIISTDRNLVITAMNDKGDVAGYKSESTGSTPFVLTSTGAEYNYQPLGNSSSPFGYVSSISNNGAIAGMATGSINDGYGHYNYVGFSGTIASGITQFGSENPALLPSKINDTGDMVGITRVGITQAGFVYYNGVANSFVFPSAGITTIADINSQGTAVGYAIGSWASKVILIDSGIIKDLNSEMALQNQLIFDWQLSAMGLNISISDSGDIYGIGVYKMGEYHAFKLSGIAPVPEPETYAMMLAGFGLLGGVARRRKQQQALA